MVGSGFDLAGALEELEGLKSRLDDDKTARKVVAPALLLMQAEKLGANETTLRYFGAVASGAIDGDGHVSAAEGKVVLTSGKHAVALLWGCCLSGARHRGGSEGREGVQRGRIRRRGQAGRSILPLRVSTA
jgi:hypothetical protein